MNECIHAWLILDRPKLKYCVHGNILEKVQRRATKFITAVDTQIYSARNHSQTGLITLGTRRLVRDNTKFLDWMLGLEVLRNRVVNEWTAVTSCSALRLLVH